jgi:DNA-binding MarR family transcriptional regulator
MTVTAEQAYYAREADRQARGPQLYGGDASVVALRCFQRYHKDATQDITDGQGLTRWVSKKQARVYGIIHRTALTTTGASTMAKIAAEAGVTTSTVSRTIHKLEAWEMYAVEIRRGRYGGITVHRKGWDRFFDYVREARKRLSETRIRAQSKLASVIHGQERGSDNGTSQTSTDMDASLKSPSFVSRVFYERAMLALADPEGEYEARRPLIGRDEIENALLMAEDVRRRQDNAIREAAFRGDWETWEQLRKERWAE